MLRVAVLGASGFIGSRMVEKFHLEETAEVRPVVRRVSSLASSSRFRLDGRVADALDARSLADAFSGCDVVVHAVAGEPRIILGTVAPVYEAAARVHVRRLVYLSSASVHGQAPAEGTIESSPLSVRQPIAYNNAKVRAERRLLRLRSRGRVELVILRPGIVFGPRSSWVTSFADALLDGAAFLLDRGAGVCNSLYVDNLVEAVRLAMVAEGADREAFLLGDRERVTWANLYRPIAGALGFDLDELPEAVSTVRQRPLRESLGRVRRSPLAREAASLLPVGLRRALRSAVAAPGEDGTASSRWTKPEARKPSATPEMELLYRCAYKLPCEKAERILGWEPTVAFDVACRRTVGWLAFAGYPVTGRERPTIP